MSASRNNRNANRSLAYLLSKEFSKKELKQISGGGSARSKATAKATFSQSKGGDIEADIDMDFG